MYTIVFNTMNLDAVVDPKLAHAFALEKKADAELQKPEKIVFDAGDALNSQLLPESRSS